MKVSGSHTEQISAWTGAGFEGAERGVIEATVDKLSREGKHVINIIHGDKTMVAGDYKKNITFLWETDTEDPVYKALQEKEAELKRLGREVGRQRTLIDVNNKRIAEIPKEITELKIRINAAEANEIYTEKDMKKEDNENIITKFVIGIVCAVLGCCFLILENSLEDLAVFKIFAVITFLIAIALNFYAFYSIKDLKKSRSERMNRKNKPIINDQKNVDSLKRQIEKLQDELKKCEVKKEELLAELEKKEKTYEEFKKKL